MAAPRAVPPDPRERFPYKSVTPRRAAMLATTSPILLFGVEAPAVSPTVAGPSGSQSLVVISAEAPNGLWRIDSAPLMPEASSVGEVGPLRDARAVGWVGVLLLDPPVHHSKAGLSPISARPHARRSRGALHDG